MGGSDVIATECSNIYTQYKQCLNLSNRNPNKCSDIESKLRICSQTLNIDYCIDESIRLLRCAKNPNKDICMKEFINMRECSRGDGRHIYIKDKDTVHSLPSSLSSNSYPLLDYNYNTKSAVYTLDENKMKYYNVKSPQISDVHTPRRDTENLDYHIKSFNGYLNFDNFENPSIPYTWESLRPSPGS